MKKRIGIIGFGEMGKRHGLEFREATSGGIEIVKMRKRIFLSMMPALFLLPALSADANVRLVDNGKACMSIVTTQNPGPAEKKAASELALFLDRMTGCGKISITGKRIHGKVPVMFVRSDEKEIQPDGFALEISDDAIKILARGDIGFLYGAYEILKRYGGVRFLVPGEDGTYIPKRKDLAVPKGKTVFNPSFAIRSGNNINMSKEGRDWLVRNNMRVLSNSARPEHYADSYAPWRMEGGQCYWRLLSGLYLDTFQHKDAVRKLDAMFQEHPERFPLINGKRMPLTNEKGSIIRQFCTTNPDVIRICSDYITRMAKTRIPDISKGFFWLAPNDVTAWCECAECRKLDSPAEAKTFAKGNRVWTFANAVTQKALAESPDSVIYGMAYQNFQGMPETVKTDPRLKVFLAFNRRCWRHNIDDRSCPTNERFRNYYRQWSDAGIDFIAWEQVDHAGRAFLPIEENVYNTLKFYKTLRCKGSYPECFAPGMKLNPKAYSRRAREAWFGMWQAMYLFAACQWDMSLDYAKTLDEINSLYYGKGWEGGMRDFRALLAKTSKETPGCFGHGHSSPLGRLLEKPKVYKQLLAFLASAEKAAASDPDPRALAHVKYDRELFADTWEKMHREYVSSKRELSALRTTAPVKIDGVLDETDWKRAVPVSGFRKTDRSGKADQQTFVRICYDDKKLYFGIEAMEPAPEKMLNLVRQHDGELWKDSTLELFISSPSLAPDYMHIIVNPSGTVFDQLVRRGRGDFSFESGIQCAVKVQRDRWVLEACVPVNAPGGILSDGQIWLVNVMRSRLLSDGVREASALGSGTPHDAGTFLPVNLAGNRMVRHSSGAEEDRKFFRNGNFSEIRKLRPKEYVNWDLNPPRVIPKYWNLASAGGSLETKKDEEGNGSVVLKRGFIFQINRLDCDRFLITGRARGVGTLNLFMINYGRKAGTNEIDPTQARLKNTMLGKVVCSPETWKNFRFEFRKTEQQRGCISALALSTNQGEIELDDVFMTPHDQE